MSRCAPENARCEVEVLINPLTEQPRHVEELKSGVNTNGRLFFLGVPELELSGSGAFIVNILLAIPREFGLAFATQKVRRDLTRCSK